MRKHSLKWISGLLLLAGLFAAPLSHATVTAANLWIDTDGGTCTRSATPIAYNTATACSSFNAAITAATAGDLVAVKSGTYSSQTISANKSSPGVTVQCEVPNWDTPLIAASATQYSCTIASLTSNGSWYTLTDITVNGGDARNASSWIARCSNCNFINFDVLGDFAYIYWLPVQGTPGGNATNIVWDGGELFDPNNPSGQRSRNAADPCNGQADQEPIWIGACSSSSSACSGDPNNFYANGRIVNGVIRRVVLNPSFVNASIQCNNDPLHLERIRIDGNIDNFLVDRVIFADGGNENTGTIFVSSFLSDSSVPAVTFRNSYISGSGTSVFQNNSGGSCPWVYQYNTFTNQPTFTGCSSGMTYTGNVLANFTVCQGTHTKNVFTGGLSSCGTDFKTTNLLLGSLVSQASAIVPASNSPVLDRGETTCATSAGGIDILGTTRPQGSACDAGAYELTANSPAVSLFPTSLSCGTVQLAVPTGCSSTTLTNTGTANLTISSITITGTNSGDFSQTNNCGSSLGASSSCTINVTFTPSAIGARSASVSVSDNASGSPHTVPLSGTGANNTVAPATGLFATVSRLLDSTGNMMDLQSLFKLPEGGM